MVHLITGYKGYEHIKSADQGRFNSSFFGASEYVTESGNQCKAQYIDNNTVRILDGDILMQGRHISIEPNSYEDLIIATGTAGYKRADLIVMTYTESETDGVEDAYLEVIKGTETTGTATLPSYTSGNILEGATFNQMPLYRVDINGVTLSQTITPLFKTIPTYATLAERYEQEFISACKSYLNSLNILDSMSEVNANTLANQLAGALALKEYTSHTHDNRYYTETEMNTKLASKQATITGGATTIASSNLTANRALIANASGKVAVSPVTSTELGYLDGVTGSIQTQLNSKQKAVIASELTDIRTVGGNLQIYNSSSQSTHTYYNALNADSRYQLPVGAVVLGDSNMSFGYGTWSCVGSIEFTVSKNGGALKCTYYLWNRTA